MTLRLNMEQQMLQDAAKRFLKNEVNGELIRSLEQGEIEFELGLWRKMAELGWMGLNIPEIYEGYGATFEDISIIMEQLGSSGLASPFFSTVVVAAEVIKAFGSEEQKHAILPQVVTGDLLLTLAYADADEPENPMDLPVTTSLHDGCLELNGRCSMVPYAHLAASIICVAQTEEQDAALILLKPDTQGLVIRKLQTTAKDGQCELILDRVMVAPHNRFCGHDKVWPLFREILHKAAVAKCAEMVGGTRRAMEIAVDYAKERIQFGQPVGAFQAVQHHCANMLTYVDTSALITGYTSSQIAAGKASIEEMAKCKAWVSDSCRKALAIAHQVHAGMGFMQESDLQIYFRRIKAAEQIFGNAAFHREIVAEELGL